VSNIQDLHGVLAHTVHVATVTRRISSSGRKRVLAASMELQGALQSAFAQSAEVRLDGSLAQRLENTSWSDILGKFELGAPDEDSLGEWLNVIDGWVQHASGCFGALRTQALEQLLVTESAVAAHVAAGTHPVEPAPEPTRVPTKYDVLMLGKERERKDTLNWWERFQIADGKVAAVARVAVAASIVAAVLGFGGTVGSSSITVFNGLDIPIVVTLGTEEHSLAPGGTYTQEFATVGVYPIAAHTRQGKVIETLQGEIKGSFGSFVYNVAGAAPLVEWTATYGNAEPEPEKYLGAPRWVRSSAGKMFQEPPNSVETKDGGAIVWMLTAASQAAPMRQLPLVPDSVEQLKLVEAHARWDATTSGYILDWLALAQQLSPNYQKILTERLAGAPDDVVLMRAAQDASTGAEHDAICADHRAKAEAAPDSANLFYLALRCVGDEAAKAQAFVEGHSHWPENGWLAYAAGYTHVEAARWNEAVAALEASRRALPPVARDVAFDVVRIRRLLGADSGRVMLGLLKSSEDLELLVNLESGKGLGKSPESAYGELARGELDKALKRAKADSAVEASVLRLAAASDGATAEIRERAWALPPTVGIDNRTRWATMALAMRDGRDYADFRPAAAGGVADPYTDRVLRFVERARTGTDLGGAEAELAGLPLLARAQAYSMATIVLGSRAPGEWRTAAKRLLFAAERPYFD
jgi:hypothetical protein